jgi:hypothetical protein
MKIKVAMFDIEKGSLFRFICAYSYAVSKLGKGSEKTSSLPMSRLLCAGTRGKITNAR